MDHLDILAKSDRYFTDRGFVGGLSLNEQDGIFAMSLHDNLYGLNLNAKKSYFFFDNIIVCLASDISETSGLGTVETTLFQGILASPSDAIYDNSLSPVTAFPYTNDYSGSAGVWLMDAFDNGYYIPNGNSLKIRKQFQSSIKPNGIDPSSGDAAVAFLDHGTTPAAKGYEYAIQIQTTPAQIQAFAAEATYQVLQKNSFAHVVKDQLTQTTGYAIFNASNAFAFDSFKDANNPCLVMIQPLASDHLCFSIADPDLHIDDGGNPDQKPSGLKDDDIFFNQSTPVTISVRLHGKWQLASPVAGANVVYSDFDQTTLEFNCADGKPIEIELIRGPFELVDFEIFADYWLMADCGYCGGADMNGNNRVDFNDLAVFIANWAQ
jgi:chondroitin-sulfate-ABC endolyase/exolyase